MIKKVSIVIAIIVLAGVLLILSVYSCAFMCNVVCYHVGFPFNPVLTWGWKRVQLENVGTIDIPINWDCIEKNDILYIVDENNESVFIEYNKNNVQIDDEMVILEELLSGEIFSNGVYIGRYSTSSSDYNELYLIDLRNSSQESIEFSLCSDTIDYKMLKWIVYTFIAEE